MYLNGSRIFISAWNQRMKDTLTLANVVKPTSVSWEQRATSSILKEEKTFFFNLWSQFSIERKSSPTDLSRGQFCPRACRMASVMLAQPDTHRDCRRWQPRQMVMSPSSVICCWQRDQKGLRHLWCQLCRDFAYWYSSSPPCDWLISVKKFLPLSPGLQ